MVMVVPIVARRLATSSRESPNLAESLDGSREIIPENGPLNTPISTAGPELMPNQWCTASFGAPNASR